MNELTLAIHAKGYTLSSFLELIGFSLRWYYTHCHEGSARYEFLKSKVESLNNLYLRDDYGRPNLPNNKTSESFIKFPLNKLFNDDPILPNEIILTTRVRGDK